uniref:Solute carrier family 25 member 27 n=1 Tax=Amazona collaria TaxID=241587 RepID=A0A8B9G2V8_9PSIT
MIDLPAAALIFTYVPCSFSSVTFPPDLTKTRLQVQGEAAVHGSGAGAGQAVPYRGMLRTAAGIMQEEGLTSLWQGATPANCFLVLFPTVYSGVRMVTYEHLRDCAWKAVVGGMCAGAIGQFFASPTDLVKVQMQMEGRRKLEGKPLWSLHIDFRAALVNMGDLTTYDSVKHFLLLNTPLMDNGVTHSVASSCSGLVAAVLGTPADVVKTRVMNQPRDKQGRGLLYKSSTDCLTQTVQGEGFMSLYKGFIPTWMRMAPWSLVFWLTYEQIRRICGVSSF